MRQILLLSRCLDYPTQELLDHADELRDLLLDLPVKAATRKGLDAFVDHVTGQRLIDWQTEYDGLFERGRSVSLHLFEHVHGESRDRGQAMVDLLNQYHEAGLELDEKELPDYLPLYLEFLSTQGENNLKAGLQEVAHILALVACRLEERESPYAPLFHALLEVSEATVPLADIRQQAAEEAPDYTSEALDKEWEEAEVTFGGDEAPDSACSSGRHRPSEQQRRDQYMPINMPASGAQAYPAPERTDG
ncbi:nitrate reductase molybdenum cofactor assembly chaperone [Natronospirillum operosum]|uniref:Nitrate reductase molybdenum cofactor assembly chaperone n=1 Tax=Natronospirillum operosum TaxID=2759953 RepID=A0A4Z0W9H9_9GAMM|nr:nitrate reductase molybdenum cofactor assembly chaperone [Natronospirillum operosum]TGG92793.1 nitrate reductase molybdenum cofactor assembly chaperone [Natronospirillum operosum]